MINKEILHCVTEYSFKFLKEGMCRLAKKYKLIRMLNMVQVLKEMYVCHKQQNSGLAQPVVAVQQMIGFIAELLDGQSLLLPILHTVCFISLRVYLVQMLIV